MKALIKLTVAAAALFLVATGAHAQNSDRSALLARGYYLATGIGLCTDCHSPRNEKGEFVPGLHLKGSAVAFTPTVPMPAWAPVAPAIAGLPTMTEAEAVMFLRTGLKPDGTRLRPPMPEYRLSEADAVALVAYLKSLGQ
jgi:mono/diheme cytochrome c family protein